MAMREGSPATRRYRPVPLDSMAPAVREAATTGEDARFWTHGGIDYQEVRHALGYRRGAVRVGFGAGPAGAAPGARKDRGARRDALRGASTITQQVAKNLYLSPSRNPLRKLKEAVTAWRLELALGKPRILELYLNIAELGDGIWGVEAASRRYFDASARRLTETQAAALAATLPFPLRSNPAYRPNRMRRRQDLILRRMRGERIEVPPVEEEPLLQPGDTIQWTPGDRFAARLPARAGRDAAARVDRDAGGRLRRLAAARTPSRRCHRCRSTHRCPSTRRGPREAASIHPAVTLSAAKGAYLEACPLRSCGPHAPLRLAGCGSGCDSRTTRSTASSTSPFRRRQLCRELPPGLGAALRQQQRRDAGAHREAEQRGRAALPPAPRIPAVQLALHPSDAFSASPRKSRSRSPTSFPGLGALRRREQQRRAGADGQRHQGEAEQTAAGLLTAGVLEIEVVECWCASVASRLCVYL